MTGPGPAGSGNAGQWPACGHAHAMMHQVEAGMTAVAMYGNLRKGITQHYITHHHSYGPGNWMLGTKLSKTS